MSTSQPSSPASATARNGHEVSHRLVDTTIPWLKEQTEPIRRPVHEDLIRLDRLYPEPYLGPVAGSFAVPQGAHPTAPGTPIEVGSPGDLLPDYRGMVYGRVAFPAGASSSGFAVHYGKVTDRFSSLGSVPTDQAGFFGIDLSAVDLAQRGAWALQLRGSDGTDVGGRWPSDPVFTELFIELRSIGVDEQTVAVLPAPITGRIVFDATPPGTKRLALVDADGTLLGATSATTGCIRSFVVAPGQPGYGTAFPEQCYVYDQAVALMAALSARRADLAHDLARGILRLQTTSGEHAGAFRLSGRQGSPASGEQTFRTGAHALATHAVLAYMQTFPQRAHGFSAAAASALGWLLARTATSGSRQGLVLGGYDTSAAGAVPLTWASTEHSIDAYFCYRLAADVLGGTWDARADALAEAMMLRLWSTEEQRFHQGVQESGPDAADPLDVHAWGAILLEHIGEHVKAVETLGDAQLAPFRVTRSAPNGRQVTGYATAYASPGYPDMVPHVWWEGTFSVAYALRKIGEEARASDVVALAAPGQLEDGSFPYVSNEDPVHGLFEYRSVASTAWATLAAIGSGIFDTGSIGSAPHSAR